MQQHTRRGTDIAILDHLYLLKGCAFARSAAIYRLPDTTSRPQPFGAMASVQPLSRHAHVCKLPGRNKEQHEMSAHLVLVLLDAAVGVHGLAGQQLKARVAAVAHARLNAVKDPEVLPRVPAGVEILGENGLSEPCCDWRSPASHICMPWSWQSRARAVQPCVGSLGFSLVSWMQEVRVRVEPARPGQQRCWAPYCRNSCRSAQACNAGAGAQPDMPIYQSASHCHAPLHKHPAHVCLTCSEWGSTCGPCLQTA